MSEPVLPHSLTWLGIDVGWVYPAADSDGRLYAWSRRSVFYLPQAGPVHVKRVDGTEFTREAYTPYEGAQALGKALDSSSVVGLAATIVKNAERSQRGIALEDWTNFQRRKSAWIRVWQGIASRAEARGVPVTQVDRAYTSMTCPSCGHKDRGNRPSRNQFLCLECGLRGQSDVIAAVNIAAKADGSFRIVPGSCANPVCEGSVAWKAGLCVSCYNSKRRRGILPTEADIEARRRRHDLPKYWRSARQRAEWDRQARWNNASSEKLRAAWRSVPIVTDDGWKQA